MIKHFSLLNSTSCFVYILIAVDCCCSQNAQQRLLQAYMLRLHMSKNLDHHVSTRRDLNWSCRAVAFRITSAGLQVRHLCRLVLCID